jgi:hypothetical protein
MFKVLALIVLGTILMGIGMYALSKVPLTALNLDFLRFLFDWNLPSVNWVLVGFVSTVASVAIFGSAFVVSRAVR